MPADPRITPQHLAQVAQVGGRLHLALPGELRPSAATSTPLQAQVGNVILAHLPPGSTASAPDGVTVDVAPAGHVWLPVSLAQRTVVPATVSGVPAGNLIPVLQVAGEGERLVGQIPDLVRSGRLAAVVERQKQRAEEDGFWGAVLRFLGPALGLFLPQVAPYISEGVGWLGDLVAEGVGMISEAAGEVVREGFTNLAISIDELAEMPLSTRLALGLTGVTGQWAPIVQAVAPALGNLAPLLALLLPLIDTTQKAAGKTLPAGVGALSLLLGRLVPRPGPGTKGVTLNVGELKRALGVLGVRFSEWGELDDVVDVEPLGNALVDAIDQSGFVWREVISTEEAPAPKALEIRERSLEEIIRLVGENLREELQRTGDLTGKTEEALRDLAKGAVGRLAEMAPPELSLWARKLVDLLKEVVGAFIGIVVDLVTGAVQVAAEPIAQPLARKYADILQRVTDRVTGEGEIHPREGFRVAQGAFAEALTAGVMAHALASLTELVHPTKELGFAHLAAGLADAAAFGPVAQQTVGAHLRVALGRPMTWRANALTRTNLPDLRAVEEMFLERRIPKGMFVERLALEGWPDRWIEAYVDVPWREPPPRELAVVFEDVEADPAWVLEMLRQNGFADQDADALMLGVRGRSQKSYRQGLLGEALGAYEEGALGVEDLDSTLETLRLRPETRRLVHQRAALARLRYVHKLGRDQYRTLVDADVMHPDDYRLALTNLGMDPEVVDALAAVAEARRTGRVAKEERAEHRRLLRETQEDLARILQEEVRRGMISPGEMAGELQRAGLDAQQARMAAALAGLRSLPVPRLPTVLSTEAAAERVREIQEQVVLEEVRRGVTLPPVGLATLLALGTPPEEAEAQILLATVRGQKPPEVPPEPKEPPEVREVRRIRTQTAVDAFRAGEIDQEGLATALQAAGHSGAVLEALVEREEVRMQIEIQEALARAQAEVERSAARAAGVAARR